MATIPPVRLSRRLTLPMRAIAIPILAVVVTAACHPATHTNPLAGVLLSPRLRHALAIGCLTTGLPSRAALALLEADPGLALGQREKVAVTDHQQVTVILELLDDTLSAWHADFPRDSMAVYLRRVRPEKYRQTLTRLIPTDSRLTQTAVWALLHRCPAVGLDTTAAHAVFGPPFRDLPSPRARTERRWVYLAGREGQRWWLTFASDSVINWGYAEHASAETGDTLYRLEP